MLKGCAQSAASVKPRATNCGHKSPACGGPRRTGHIMFINGANWTSGDFINFVVDYVASPDVLGRMQINSTENSGVDGVVAELTTTAEVGLPTITSVNGDDKIKSGDLNIAVVGTNFTNANRLRIYRDTEEEVQTIISNDGTEIRFDYDGGLTAGTGYKLAVRVDQVETDIDIEIEPETTVGVPVSIVQVFAQDDYIEYTDLDVSPFPGTLAGVTDATSETDFLGSSIVVGKIGYSGGSNSFYGAVKIGPITENANTVFNSFNLRLPVSSAYKYNNMTIKAVADPSIEIGPGVLPSAQTLTTASRLENSSNWVNSDPTSYWLPEANPKPIDVKSIAEEVLTHPNWSSGSSIWFVVTFSDLGGLQGWVSWLSTKQIESDPAGVRYSVNFEPTINSVSSDNIVALGEEGVTIAGANLSGASNLLIEKGAISEAQTIISNDDNSIVFDVTTGAIVADTGYTISFEIGGITFSDTIEFIQGGGVNVGTTNQTYDGFEDTVNNTWYDDFSTGGAIIIGPSPFLAGGSGQATATIGPINAIQSQTITKADLTWGAAWGSSNYKAHTFEIRAVSNSKAAQINSTNLPADQTLTTASVSVDTTSWVGVNLTSYWVPGAEVIDISGVVQEVVNGSNWATGDSIQLVFTEISAPFGNANTSFGSTESAAGLLTFDYETGSAQNIANVNGSDVIRNGTANILVSGTDLASTTEANLTIDGVSEVQSIATVTANLVTLTYKRGKLGYGSGVLTLVSNGVDVTFNVNHLPALGRDYVVIDSTNYTGDNSLIFDSVPKFLAGDQIEFDVLSSNGFSVSIATNGVPSITGGSGVDSFDATSWKKSTGQWFNEQTINIEPATYFDRFLIPTLYIVKSYLSGEFRLIAQDTGGSESIGDITGQGPWTERQDTDDIDPNETWS